MNNQLQIFENSEFGQIRTLEENGKVLFSGTDVARVLGYSNPWDALKRHCLADGVVKREGVSETTNQHGATTQQVTEMTFITEGNVYRLITHSKLPSAEKFERWVFDEVLPTIRKQGSYAVPILSSTDLLELQIKALREIEDRQGKQERALGDTNKRIDNLGEVIALNTQAWREDTRNLIVRIARAMGDIGYINEVQRTIYKLVDERASVSLETRLTNKRRRMADEGMCKSKRDKTNKLDVIADDKKLIEIYTAIVKEMAVKYLEAKPIDDKEELGDFGSEEESFNPIGIHPSQLYLLPHEEAHLRCGSSERPTR